MSQTARSAPCPCGSGLKYKRCHGSDIPPSSDPGEIAWRAVRHALDSSEESILAFFRKRYGQRGFSEAWDDFILGDAERFPTQPDYLGQFFMSWFRCCWRPDPEESQIKNADLAGRPPLQSYLEQNGGKLKPLLLEYFTSVINALPSFWEVIECQPGRGARMRDMFTLDEHFVYEQSATKVMGRGDVMFGLLAHVNGIAMLEGCGGCPITPRYKPEIIELRERIVGDRKKISREELAEWDLESRRTYLLLADRIMNPPIPELRNTDGHKLVPQTLQFDISSPERAYEALQDLGGESNYENSNPTLRRDERGALTSVELSWLKRAADSQGSMGATSLGQIVIKGKRLSASVNSVERGAELRGIIESSMGADAVWRATESTNLEREIEAHRRGKKSSARADRESEELMRNPDVQKQLRAMLSAHYEGWADVGLPALGGRTPREAVQDRKGRDIVNALIESFERGGNTQGMGVEPDPTVFVKLRAELGLD